ncbi:MAG: carbonic anhydrase [Chloroflexota bacterium]
MTPISSMTATQALDALLEGNERYVDTHPVHPHVSAGYRRGLIGGQHPFAAILGCADSRVPPELLFDQGFGDLFVIRVAGNVVDNFTLASIEYAVVVLGVPLVMVLAHSGCGAVSATVSGAALPGHMGQLAAHIRPAVEAACHREGDCLDNAIRENARLAVAHLINTSEPIRQAVEAENVQVVAAYYDLDTGRVSLLED